MKKNNYNKYIVYTVSITLFIIIILTAIFFIINSATIQDKLGVITKITDLYKKAFFQNTEEITPKTDTSKIYSVQALTQKSASSTFSNQELEDFRMKTANLPEETLAGGIEIVMFDDFKNKNSYEKYYFVQIQNGEKTSQRILTTDYIPAETADKEFTIKAKRIKEDILFMQHVDTRTLKQNKETETQNNPSTASAIAPTITGAAIFYKCMGLIEATSCAAWNDKTLLCSLMKNCYVGTSTGTLPATAGATAPIYPCLGTLILDPKTRTTCDSLPVSLCTQVRGCELVETICSNGLREGNEECDGTDFGGKTCTSLGYGSGDLKCTGCIIDKSGCTKKYCKDGTLIGQCSMNRPLFCDSLGQLVSKCLDCNCPTGATCTLQGQCVDNTPPAGTLISPKNGEVFVENSEINFVCSGTDNIGLSKVEFYIGKTLNDTIMLAESKIISGTIATVTFSRKLTTGTYFWNCKIYDASGNSVWANPNLILQISVKKTCSDGTVMEQCNGKIYCNANLQLEEDCTRCGCLGADRTACNVITKKCVPFGTNPNWDWCFESLAENGEYIIPTEILSDNILTGTATYESTPFILPEYKCAPIQPYYCGDASAQNVLPKCKLCGCPNGGTVCVDNDRYCKGFCKDATSIGTCSVRNPGKKCTYVSEISPGALTDNCNDCKCGIGYKCDVATNKCVLACDAGIQKPGTCLVCNTQGTGYIQDDTKCIDKNYPKCNAEGQCISTQCKEGSVKEGTCFTCINGKYTQDDTQCEAGFKCKDNGRCECNINERDPYSTCLRCNSEGTNYFQDDTLCDTFNGQICNLFGECEIKQICIPGKTLEYGTQCSVCNSLGTGYELKDSACYTGMCSNGICLGMTCEFGLKTAGTISGEMSGCKCSDETLENECSKTYSGYYCKKISETDGELYPNCGKCGCFEGVCNSYSNQCVPTDEKAGPKRVIIVFYRFSDSKYPNMDTSAWKKEINYVSGLYNLYSYGNTWMTLDDKDIYTMPEPLGTYLSCENLDTTMKDVILYMREHNTFFANSLEDDPIVVAITSNKLTNGGIMDCDFTGLSKPISPKWDFSRKKYNMVVVFDDYLGTISLRNSILPHEIGHTYGFYHSNLLYCPVSGFVSYPITDCKLIESIDITDIMSAEFGEFYPTINYFHRFKADWSADILMGTNAAIYVDELANPPSEGIYKIYDMDTLDRNKNAILVLKYDEMFNFYVQYKPGFGVFVNLASKDGSNLNFGLPCYSVDYDEDGDFKRLGTMDCGDSLLVPPASHSFVKNHYMTVSGDSIYDAKNGRMIILKNINEDVESQEYAEIEIKN